MKTWTMLAAMLLLGGMAVTRADDKVTVEATNEDISESLDLKAVANLFGEVKDLKEFEEKLNAEDTHLSNLDLNGDGSVDYLRVVETKDGDNHLVLIQAVLAKDVFQDVASIYVEHKGNKEVTVQVVGDEYIYGTNYVIEPVYIYRPVIYDWFWGPAWVCWTSPWYWGYWPGWYTPYPCWAYRDYHVHIHVYHHDHPRCSYRYAKEPSVRISSMRGSSGRSDFARANADRSFSSRTGMTNARDLSATRAASARSGVASSGRSTTASSGRSAAVTSSERSVSSNTSSSSRSAATFGSRNVSATRSSSTPASTASSRSAVSTTSSTRSSSATPSSSRSSYSTSATPVTRNSYSGTTSSTRSTYSGSSTPSSSRSVYGGSSASSARSSYSGSGYSGSSRSSYSGGGYSGGGRSSAGFSGGSSSRGGGGYSGGSGRR
ncbi:MAG: hypothetical protein MJZ64_05990 [Paludibacteraceae bacterium]|nr:hypothetical protein [Paludibacteraceae bacterium]